MEDNFYNIDVDTTINNLENLYDENIYSNENKEITADMVNECFYSTAQNLGDLIKKIISMNCKISAYRNMTLVRDTQNVNKSYIVASADQGWLIRVDIPRLIDYFYFVEFSEETSLASILTTTGGMIGWDPLVEGFAVLAATYNNRTWNQGDIWAYERELEISDPIEYYTLLFFVEQQGDVAIVPSLAISDEYYWETGPLPKNMLNPITYPNSPDNVIIDFKLEQLLCNILIQINQ